MLILRQTAEAPTYILAPDTATTVPIAILDDGTTVMGCFDIDGSPLCAEATTAHWQIGGGGDGCIQIEHRALDIQVGIKIAQLPVLCEQIRALAALLESGTIEQINTLVCAWDGGELAPLPRG